MTGTEKAQHRKHAEPYQHIGKFRCLNLFGQRIIKKESRHHGPKARKGQRQRAVQKNADSRLDQRSADTQIQYQILRSTCDPLIDPAQKSRQKTGCLMWLPDIKEHPVLRYNTPGEGNGIFFVNIQIYKTDLDRCQKRHQHEKERSTIKGILFSHGHNTPVLQFHS